LCFYLFEALKLHHAYSRRGIDRSLDNLARMASSVIRFLPLAPTGVPLAQLPRAFGAILSGDDGARGIELLILDDCSCAGNCHMFLSLIQDCFRLFGLKLGLLMEMATHLVFIEFLAPLADYHCSHAVAD
jgi:hypothetical protein